MNNDILKELNIIDKKINNTKIIDNNMKAINNLNKDLKKILKNNNVKPKTFPQQKVLNKPKTFPQQKVLNKPKTFPQQKLVNKSKININSSSNIANTIWKIFVILLFITIIVIVSVILYRIHHTLYIYDVKEIPLAITDTTTSAPINTAGAPINNTGDMTENPYLTLYGGGVFNISGLDAEMQNYRNLQSLNYDDGITKQIYIIQRKHHLNDYIRNYNKSAININKAIDKYNSEINNVYIENSISEDEKKDLIDLYEIKEYEQELTNSPIELSYNIQYPEWVTNNTQSSNSITPNCTNLNSNVECNNSPFVLGTMAHVKPKIVQN